MQSSYTTVSLIVAATVPTGGVLVQVFNELGLTLALMGGLGGALHGMLLGGSILLTLRGALIGAILAFGIGVNAPAILAFAFSGKFALDSSPLAVGALMSCAFLLGLAQDRFLDRVLKRNEKEKQDGQA